MVRDSLVRGSMVRDLLRRDSSGLRMIKHAVLGQSSGMSESRTSSKMPAKEKSLIVLDPRHLSPFVAATAPPPVLHPRHLSPFVAATAPPPVLHPRHLSPFVAATAPPPALHPRHLSPSGAAFVAATAPPPVLWSPNLPDSRRDRRCHPIRTDAARKSGIVWI